MDPPYFAETELILSSEGRIYHLDLLPEELADTVLLVGDPARVAKLSKHFDSIDCIREHREFITHTGWIHNRRISVISTGIGTDNMELACIELDALATIDFKTRTLQSQPRRLKFIRLGTCGGIQPEHHPGTVLVSAIAFGLDGLSEFYNSTTCIDQACTSALSSQLQIPDTWPSPYAVHADTELLRHVQHLPSGITLTAPGFYAPQGRRLRLKLKDELFLNRLPACSYNALPVVNFEMETSALYFLGRTLGHQTLSLCVVVGNRYTKTFSKNVSADTNHLIDLSLQLISGL